MKIIHLIMPALLFGIGVLIMALITPATEISEIGIMDLLSYFFFICAIAYYFIAGTIFKKNP